MTLKPPRPLLLLAGAAAVVVCIPLLYLAIRAAEGGIETARLVLTAPRTWQAVVASLLLALTVALATVLIGVPAAWLVTRATIKLRRLWTVLLILPLAVPSFVAAVGWVSLVPGFSGFWAAWLVLTAATVPYVILPTAAALRGIDPAHEEVARTLGLSAIPAFIRAALPQLLPAVGGGALLVALYVLSDFGAVSILRVDTLSRTIYAAYKASFDRSAAAVLAIILALLAILVVAIEQRARGRTQRWRLATSAPREPDPVAVGRWRAPAYGLLIAIAGIGLAVPILATIVALFTGRSARFETGILVQTAMTSAWFGVVGMIVAVLLAIPVGVLAGRFPSPMTRGLERVSFVGHALPGVVVGLSVVFVGTRLLPGIYQTVLLLALAYGVLFLPKAAAAIRGSISTVPPVLEDVARSLGKSPFHAFSTITLRLSAPGIGAGAVLVLLTVMKELPATLMLRPTGSDTLATRLWSLTEVGQFAAAAPYALGLVMIGAIPALALAFPLVRSDRKRSSQADAQRDLEVSMEGSPV